MGFITVRGVRYHVVAEGAGPPLIMLHGFMGNVRSWDHIADILQQHVRLIRLDLPGHGMTEKNIPVQRYGLWETAHDVLAIADAFRIRRFHLLGYSFGGRVAQHIALLAPERIRALILESASPGIADTEQRRARRRADEERAKTIETYGMRAFVSQWESLPLFASERCLPLQQQAALRWQRVTNNPLGLARSLRGAGTGTQHNTLPRLKQFPRPTLLLAGALDEQYTNALQRMVHLMPRAQLRIVDDAGHAVHRERPKCFVECILKFLRDIRAV